MKKFKISQIQFQAKSTPQENADILEKNYNKSLKFKPDLICTPECSNIITNDKIHLFKFHAPVIWNIWVIILFSLNFILRMRYVCTICYYGRFIFN